MTHDPMLHDPVLDAWMNDLDDDPNYSDYLALIARVREDERMKEYNRPFDEVSVLWHKRGYAAALRDAVPLLKGILLEVEQHMDHTDYRIYKEYRKEVFVQFQAAIEALGGER